MAQLKTMSLVYVVAIVMILTIRQVQSECCPSVQLPSGRGLLICYDGRPIVGWYCGVGPCNMFGCNCEGGCRNNSKGYDYEEAIRLYKHSIDELTPL